LEKGSNLCHGTGGNAYAFLKLAALTGDPAWIEPAQAFAMTAIEQYRAAKAEYGRVRFSLWTGDIGLAVFLHECLAGTARFPNVDVF
jgi:predicted esterase